MLLRPSSLRWIWSEVLWHCLTAFNWVDAESALAGGSRVKIRASHFRNRIYSTITFGRIENHANIKCLHKMFASVASPPNGRGFVEIPAKQGVAPAALSRMLTFEISFSDSRCRAITALAVTQVHHGGPNARICFQKERGFVEISHTVTANEMNYAYVIQVSSSTKLGGLCSDSDPDTRTTGWLSDILSTLQADTVTGFAHKAQPRPGSAHQCHTICSSRSSNLSDDADRPGPAAGSPSRVPGVHRDSLNISERVRRVPCLLGLTRGHGRLDIIPTRIPERPRN